MQKQKLIQLLTKIRTPLLMLGALLLINLLSFLKIIPSISELTQHIVKLFEQYGLFIIPIMSFFENILILNFYFPGSIVILIAMSLTAGDPARAILTFIFIVVPAMLAHFLNYYIGREINKNSNKIIYCLKNIINFFTKTHSEFQKERKNLNLSSRNENSAETWFKFASALWHPHLASIICFDSGLSGMEFRKFLKYFLTVGLLWNVFWGFTMYYFGHAIKVESTLLPVAYYIYLSGWIIIAIIKFCKASKVKQS